MQQPLPDFLSGMHRHNQQSRLDRMTEMLVTSSLSRTRPAIGFENAY
jgi:hypothetical protein